MLILQSFVKLLLNRNKLSQGKKRTFKADFVFLKDSTIYPDQTCRVNRQLVNDHLSITGSHAPNRVFVLTYRE